MKNILKSVSFIFFLILIGYSQIRSQAVEAYAYEGALASYGTINLSTGAFTTLSFRPQGNNYYPLTADTDTLNSHYAIMATFSQSNFYLWNVNFTTLTSDSIAPVGPLAAGQNRIKGMAYNKINDTWYLISGNNTGTAAYLYTLSITSGALSVIGQIQNANFPTGIAIDCSGSAYIINMVPGSPSNTAILNSLNLTTAIATAIGTNLGLSFVTGFTQDMSFNPDNGNLYWTGYWQQGFSEGSSFRLVDVMTGTSTEISAFGQFHSLTGFNVNGICPAASTFQLSVDVINSWNMVSVPGINTNGMGVDEWWEFRDMTASVFKFTGSYIPVTTTEPGEGYWMKHVGTRTYNTGDEWPAGGIQIVTHDPLVAMNGWNLIGGYDQTIPVGSITTTPPGLITTTIYGYNGSYVPASDIVPGYAYWMKMDAAGSINLGGPLGKEGAQTIAQIKEDWGKITITDAAQRTFTLYAVNEEVVDLDFYEMPPMPPAGSFDVRFSSNRMAEDLNNSQTIEMSGIVHPITVKVENVNISLLDETGKEINALLKSGEQITLSGKNINKLTVLSGEIVTPEEYSLEQNYPNPFNPSTSIKFSLPETADVSLVIYNALGQKVTELANGKLEAGKYSYQWDASDVATGMYIYELSASNFVSVKKMILIK
jgi:hypothetical protein